jgi:hypothetical protein
MQRQELFSCLSSEYIANSEVIMIGRPKAEDKKVFERSAEYKGISKNGFNTWQIQIYMDNKKIYLGSVNDQLMAARLHDIFYI